MRAIVALFSSSGIIVSESHPPATAGQSCTGSTDHVTMRLEFLGGPGLNTDIDVNVRVGH
jgi:hypothetical protein